MMTINFAKPSLPGPDKRWKIVDATMRRAGQNSRGLIETLHTVQEAFGYLDEAALRYVAGSLRVPLSRAYGVATFYHLFALKPPGKHACVVCNGTACHIKGSARLVAVARRTLGINLGKTTLDGKVSLRGERCIGPCGLAPVVVYDGQVAAEESPEALSQRLQQWMAHDT
jgi:bidirectional [NiFe] hydrogenase diaphorase subunit